MTVPLSTEIALTRMQQSGRSLTPDDGTALAFADAATSSNGATTEDSPVISDIDTAGFCVAGDPSTWAVTVSAGFASAEASIRVLSKTANTLTLAQAATSSEASVTVACVKAYKPVDECFAVRCKSAGSIYVHLFNDPAGKITELVMAADVSEGMHIDCLFERGPAGNTGAVAAANIIPLGV